MPRFHLFLIIILLTTLGACSQNSPQNDPRDLSWEEVEEEAKNSKVTMMMWMGDPLINEYMNGYVKPQVKERLGIDLEIVNGQGTQIVSTLMSELESGRAESQIDMMWINGETFYQLRQIDGLFGPFTESLPNMHYVDLENPFIGIDFQQPVDGYEAPWGNVQFTLIYDPDQVNSPPQDFEEFQQWVRQNPRKFTIPTDFSGITLLKSWMLAMPENPDVFYGEFDEAIYQEYSTRLWEEINAIKSDFWRNGETFPNSVAQLHQLFSNGEVAFTMSNNDSEVDNKITEGVFPEDSRGYVLESGTIQNSHFLGIAKLSSNKAGAMAVINFMISPEAQFEKMKPQVWGDGTVLSMEKIPEEWQQKFSEIPGRKQAPERIEIQEKALQEPDPEYMIRLFEDFREFVVDE
ncbi:ABC transporter substrate-binding protein [Gracilimonas sp.]|uniref:ABC transporter substrate-binding protein n=1 Tax=Gracilimonas sp. TaxID=1974203 RepID=UPI0028728DDF|nr:ABC transporter substrate-binding protein [Gracilimonas sp.]